MLESVVWNGQKFAAVGSGGTVLTSNDGTDWVKRLSGTDEVLYDIAWNGNQLVAVGDKGVIITSPDGVNWTERTSLSRDVLKGIVWNGSQFVAVGFNIMIRSYDGVSWVKIQAIDAPFRDIIWDGNRFIAVGYYDCVLISLDGIDWTRERFGTNYLVEAVIWDGNRYICVGRETILTSPDGIVWEEMIPGTQTWLYDIAWDGYKYVVVGHDSIILTAVPKDLIKVKVNGKSVIFDVAPIIKDGRTLVPLRAIFEVLGAEVRWDEETETITGIRGSSSIVIQLNSSDALVNGEHKELEVPATAINGRTFVPTRFIAESLGTKVNWDGNTKTVLITDK